MSLTVTDKGNATVTTSNGYEVYQFTTVGSSSVTFSGSGTIDLLVVGGGGGSLYYNYFNTTYHYSGGAGGFIEILDYPINAGLGTLYNIVVGKGGSCTTAVCNDSSEGNSSSFVNTVAGGIGAGGGGAGSKRKNGKNYNTGTTGITHGCGGSGLYYYEKMIGGMTTLSNAGSSNISGISGTVTIGSNNGENTSTYKGAGGAASNGDGIVSQIIGETCSAAKQNSEGSYGSNGNNTTNNNASGKDHRWTINGKDGIVAFRIRTPPTIAPTMSPTTMSPTTPGSTIALPSTTNPILTTPGSTRPLPTTLYNTPPTSGLVSYLQIDRELQKNIENKMDQRNQEGRLIELNDSYRKRYLDYIKLVMTAVFGSLFLWLFNVMNQYEILPSGIIDLFIIITVSMCIVYIYILWTNIQTHDLLNYDEIDYPPPNANENAKSLQSPSPTTNQRTIPVSTSNKNNENSKACSNPVCPSGYKYSERTKMCELNANLDTTQFILGEIRKFVK